MAKVRVRLPLGALCVLDRAVKVPDFQSGQASSILAGHSQNLLLVRSNAFRRSELHYAYGRYYKQFWFMAHRSSMEWTPPCHGGDHRFKSGMGRYFFKRTVRQRLERLVLETSDCEFESRPYDLLNSRGSANG